MKTSFDWDHYDKNESMECIDTADGVSINQYDDFAERHRVAYETCCISGSIKSTSIWNRLQRFWCLYYF